MLTNLENIHSPNLSNKLRWHIYNICSTLVLHEDWICAALLLLRLEQQSLLAIHHVLFEDLAANRVGHIDCAPASASLHMASRWLQLC